MYEHINPNRRMYQTDSQKLTTKVQNTKAITAT